MILVYTGFRRHEVYINFCKYFGSKYKVGIKVFTPIETWEHTEKQFVKKCLSYGAEIVKTGADCNSLILPRFGDGFKEKIKFDIPKLIKYKSVFVLTDSFMSGVPNIEFICNFIGDPIVVAPAIDFFGMLELESRDFIFNKKLKVMELGLPFKKYSIIDSPPTMDYLLAYPSHASVFSVVHEYEVIRNLYKILKEIPKEKKVYVKIHNVKAEGNRLSNSFFYSRYPKLKFLMGVFLAISNFLDMKISGKALYTFMPKRILEPLKKVQNDFIFFNTINLLENYPAFGIEHYLPFVKEGVITGISNTIPLSLLMEVPVLNIDSRPSEDSKNRDIMINSLGIMNWKGFSKMGFSKFSPSSRQADFVQFLEIKMSQNL